MYEDSEVRIVFWSEKSGRKGPLGEPRHRWSKTNIKIDLERLA
jgi:hypothetical protein